VNFIRRGGFKTHLYVLNRICFTNIFFLGALDSDRHLFKLTGNSKTESNKYG